MQTPPPSLLPSALMLPRSASTYKTFGLFRKSVSISYYFLMLTCGSKKHSSACPKHWHLWHSFAVMNFPGLQRFWLYMGQHVEQSGPQVLCAHLQE